ncbi:hypothetical protein CWO91_13490 [Bradyrhizobium genosp. SA-3]|nr:hypothetical protein CWO91_13490 [Bradyrhizobium genosp. SA-3]
MATSVETIVSAYVRLKNREALENMRELRRQLLAQLQSTSSIDPAESRDALLEDLRVIEGVAAPAEGVTDGPPLHAGRAMC